MAKTPIATEDQAPAVETPAAAPIPAPEAPPVDPGADAVEGETADQTPPLLNEEEKQALAEAAKAEAKANAEAAAAKAEKAALEAFAAANPIDTKAAEAAEAKAAAAAEAAAATAKAAAEAEADAAHQKKVQAKAERDAKAAAKAAARNEAEREGRLEKLNDLLTTVELGNTTKDRDQLVADLAAGHGGEMDDEIFSLADITVLRAATLDRTLADWCMEARRQIMATA